MDLPQTKTHSRLVREFYFWSGLVATLAYRIIIVLNNYSALWVKISWYIGTVGFILYFIHRYQISQHRVALIKNYDLANRISAVTALSNEEKSTLHYILYSLQSSKEKLNYIFIFFTSAVALLIGLYFDFLA
ncbi:hypothetical protein KKC17_03915 [Patescibacteria group bacterium]|nr:hypothetical protein [Patescibacteria group bacterium]